MLSDGKNIQGFWISVLNGAHSIILGWKKNYTRLSKAEREIKCLFLGTNSAPKLQKLNDFSRKESNSHLLCLPGDISPDMFLERLYQHLSRPGFWHAWCDSQKKKKMWILYCYTGCQAPEVGVYLSISIRIISRNTEMNYSMHFKWKSLGRQQELNSQVQLKFFQEINSNFLQGSWTNHKIKCSRLTHMCSLVLVI